MSSKIGHRAIYGAGTSAIVKPVYVDSSCVCAVEGRSPVLCGSMTR